MARAAILAVFLLAVVAGAAGAWAEQSALHLAESATDRPVTLSRPIALIGAAIAFIAPVQVARNPR